MKLFLKNAQFLMLPSQIAAVVWILLNSLLFSREAQANAHLDRQYRLESLGILKSEDNVDQIMSEYLENAYQNFFNQQTRFQTIQSKTVQTVLSDSKLPYSRVISDPEVLAQIARVTHVDSLLRTRVAKTGNTFHFKMDWLHSPQTEVLGSIDFSLDLPASGESFDQSKYSESIQKNLALLIAQVPFQGQITGRDRSSVTLSLGEQDHLKPGDILTISTVDDVRRHPLLKNISEWKLTTTGRVKVDRVEKGMSFGSILDEEPGKQISKYQKISIIQHSSISQSGLLASNASPSQSMEPSKDFSVDPEIGWGAFTLPIGNLGRSFSSGNPALSYLSDRFTFGARVESQILLNRDFFTFIRLNYQLWSHQQSDPNTGIDSPATKNGGVPGTQSSFLASFGYQFSLTHSLAGPQGWVSLAYKGTSVDLPISATEATGPYTFKSLLLGTGVNFEAQDHLMLQASLRYRLITTINANNLPGTGAVSGTADVEFYLGMLYQMSEQFAFRGGIEIQTLSAEFQNGSSLSQKTMTFSPALLYYF